MPTPAASSPDRSYISHLSTCGVMWSVEMSITVSVISLYSLFSYSIRGRTHALLTTLTAASITTIYIWRTIIIITRYTVMLSYNQCQKACISSLLETDELCQHVISTDNSQTNLTFYPQFYLLSEILSLAMCFISVGFWWCHQWILWVLSEFLAIYMYIHFMQ